MYSSINAEISLLGDCSIRLVCARVCVCVPSGETQGAGQKRTRKFFQRLAALILLLPRHARVFSSSAVSQIPANNGSSLDVLCAALLYFRLPRVRDWPETLSEPLLSSRLAFAGLLVQQSRPQKTMNCTLQKAVIMPL